MMADDGAYNKESLAQANLDCALGLASAGIPVFPVRIERKGQGSVWDKRPCFKGWAKSATTDEEQIKSWWSEYSDAVPGIPLGRIGLAVIDVDVHEGGSDGHAALNNLLGKHGELPAGTPIVETAGGGLHIYFKQPSDDEVLGNAEGDLPPGINVRGHGGLVVAPGSIRADGRAYRYVDSSPSLGDALRDGRIPVVPAWLVDIIRKQKREGGPPESAEQMYAAVALKRCHDEVACSSRGKRNQTLNAVAFRLGRMIGAGWLDSHQVEKELLRAATSCGLLNDDGAEAVRRTITSGLDAGTKKPVPPISKARLSKPNAQPTCGPVWWDGEKPKSSVKWLVRDLIPEHAVGLLVGESQAGKSFLAVHLAACVATEEEFFGKRVIQGGTIYIAAEGADTLDERIEAARRGVLRIRDDKNNALEKFPLAVIEDPPDLANPDGLKALLESIRQLQIEMHERHGVPLRLVIVDTMLTSCGIEDWNGPAEARNAMMALKAVADETGATVIGIHHLGKDPSRGAVGSFAFSAIADFMLTATKSSASRFLELTKTRRREPGWRYAFDLKGVTIGLDESGDELPCAYVVPGTTSTHPFGAEPKVMKQAAFLVSARSAIETTGVEITVGGQMVRAARLEDVRTAYVTAYRITHPNTKPESEGKAFSRAKTGAVDAGLVTIAKGDRQEHYVVVVGDAT